MTFCISAPRERARSIAYSPPLARISSRACRRGSLRYVRLRALPWPGGASAGSPAPPLGLGSIPRLCGSEESGLYPPILPSTPLPKPVSRARRWIAPAAVCASLSLALGIALRDYMRLDVTRITGTSVTLTAAAQARRDTETMRELAHGLMAPLAELWIVIGAPLTRSDLADRLAMSERVARYWPAHAVVTRRAVFLALDGEEEKARSLLARALETFPHRLDATLLILGQARSADPHAIQALLALARAARTD